MGSQEEIGVPRRKLGRRYDPAAGCERFDGKLSVVQEERAAAGHFEDGEQGLLVPDVDDGAGEGDGLQGGGGADQLCGPSLRRE